MMMQNSNYIFIFISSKLDFLTIIYFVEISPVPRARANLTCFRLVRCFTKFTASSTDIRFFKVHNLPNP